MLLLLQAKNLDEWRSNLFEYSLSFAQVTTFYQIHFDGIWDLNLTRAYFFADFFQGQN